MSGLDVVVLHGAALDRPDERDTLRAAQAVRGALRRLGHEARVARLAPDLATLDALTAAPPALVFNLVEAIGGDGRAATATPGLLAERGLRFTGCGPEAERHCADKPTMKRRMAALGLPTPDWCETGRGLREAPCVIVKACAEHASIGLDAGSVVTGDRAADEIRSRARRFGTDFFAETFVDGREFNVALLDGAVLPAAEILFDAFPRGRPRIVDYEAKWIEGAFAHANTPRRFGFPDADSPLLDALGALARRAWEGFALRGYARVDFRVDRDGRPWALEVNTNPCLSRDAGFAAAAARGGLGFDAVIAAIVAAATDDRRAAA
jgi:D-alanine-D-alanine ligase